ncbi:ABC transporter permease subunit [Xinfangfangia sp. CPCC 101601]|uniref:ABC transporter permease subunit n=1 Tax=Pseudogemmobacter lacusdianii TaxID=3069608 RepID=A0ABU0VX39_9RHOB|nr:ABC transporter permease subunit [Xinfangfangia sp. CPCC 101601]MDQ2066331.1 ABC transporter permease subunit [Xinfangfangia sp. CPCC 101601]
MLRFIGKRLWNGALTLAALVTLTFFVMRLAPGGPFSRNRKISKEVQANIEAAFHLDEPVIQQFGRFVWRLLHFDLGPSTRFRDYSVNDLIASGLPYSLTIGFWAMVVATFVGIALGILGALRRNGMTDYVAGTIGVIGIAIPIFVIGPVAQAYFALHLGWLPVGGMGAGWKSWVLPVLVLALPNIAYISRLTRTSMIETMRENYVRTARAKGIGGRRVLLKHTLKGALLPVVAYLGPATAAIITGSVLIETVFALPGIGRHFVDAALNRDYPLVTGITLLYGGIVILFNIGTDVLRAWMDPRLRHA